MTEDKVREPTFWFDREYNHMAYRHRDGRLEHIGFYCRHEVDEYYPRILS